MRPAGSRDGPARRRDHPPMTAELLNVLAQDLAGQTIAHVVIQRVPGVGQLMRAVAAAGDADQRRARTCGAAPPAGDEEWRPRPRARPGTGALRPGVMREQAQGVSAL